jgi:hypothetical protein
MNHILIPHVKVYPIFPEHVYPDYTDIGPFVPYVLVTDRYNIGSFSP